LRKKLSNILYSFMYSGETSQTKEKKFMEKQAFAVVVSFQNPPFSPSRDKRLIFSNYSSPRSLIFSNC